MRLPSSDAKPQAILSPDGILHSKYTARKVGKGTYVFCWRKAVEELPTTAYKRISQHLHLPDSLADYVAHLLRLRVLQELELLTEQVEFVAKRGFKHTPVLRRLTYEEWGQLQSTNKLHCERPLAILIVPPLRKRTDAGEKPAPSMSPLPPQDQEYPQDPPSICEMLSSAQRASTLSGSLPQRMTPLYNAVSTFPSRSQRAALHALLLRLLTAERMIKRQSANTLSKTFKGSSSMKSSHAFLLSSSLDQDQHGDPAALSVALWRLHMYERSSWSNIIT
ncbi:hypothetical protein BJ165DRAFT_1521080 [Panaeolus papilionaceus]|nr:hypothetical protein BJ165DRAFT_1521080 [Panaeolus papilionaceus]